MTLKDNNDGTFSIVAPCSLEKPTKEEALKLADEMDGIEFFDNPNSDPYEWAKDSRDMIRRLVEELDKKKAILSVNNIASDADLNLLNSKKIIAQTKPLSAVEIIGMSGKYDFNYEVDIIDFVRAIEERHGIK